MVLSQYNNGTMADLYIRLQAVYHSISPSAEGLPPENISVEGVEDSIVYRWYNCFFLTDSKNSQLDKY